MSSACPPRQPDFARGAQRPARRRAGGRDPGLSEERRPRLASRTATIETDPKKGEFYVAVIEQPGRATLGRLAEIMPAIIRAFPWPKSMRWGAASAKPERPALGAPAASHSSCTFGDRETRRRRRSCRFEVDGIASGNVTCGHRFMAPAADHSAPLRRLCRALQKAKVVLDADRRKAIILPTPRISPSRRGSSWSRTRACSRRSPAWSNGRWC